jgi:hypothetical protein
MKPLAMSSLAAALMALLVVPPSLTAQTATKLRLGIGAASDAFVPRGVVGLVGGTRLFNSVFGLRGEALLGGVERRVSGGGLLAGVDGVLLVRAPGDVWAPYLAGGVGYTRTAKGAGRSLAYHLGVNALVGIETTLAGRRWFLEARSRFFGNVFEERAVTQSVLVLVVGRAW